MSIVPTATERSPWPPGFSLRHHRGPDRGRGRGCRRWRRAGSAGSASRMRGGEALADQAALAVAAVGVEAVADDRLAVAHDVGDHGDEARGHLAEIDVGVADRRGDRLVARGRRRCGRAWDDSGRFSGASAVRGAGKTRLLQRRAAADEDLLAGDGGSVRPRAETRPAPRPPPAARSGRSAAGAAATPARAGSCSIGVSVAPGAITFTVMPRGGEFQRPGARHADQRRLGGGIVAAPGRAGRGAAADQHDAPARRHARAQACRRACAATSTCTRHIAAAAAASSAPSGAVRMNPAACTMRVASRDRLQARGERGAGPSGRASPAVERPPRQIAVAFGPGRCTCQPSVEQTARRSRRRCRNWCRSPRRDGARARPRPPWRPACSA